jgi:hypothetical protein
MKKQIDKMTTILLSLGNFSQKILENLANSIGGDASVDKTINYRGMN